MKIPTHKGKFALVMFYATVVFLMPVIVVFFYNPSNMLHSIATLVPANDDQFFRDYISLLKDQNVGQAYLLLSPEAQHVTTQSDLINIATKLSTVSTTSETIIGAKITYIKGVSPYTSYNMQYQMVNDDPVNKYKTVVIAARNLGQGIKIDHLQVSHSSESIVDEGKFTLPLLDWTLAASLLAPLFVVYTAYRYLIKATHPKWLWLIGILFLSLYVTVQSGPSYVANFGVYGFMTPLSVFGPWVYSPFVPVGAILYYFFRSRLEIVEVADSSSTRVTKS